MTAQTNIVQHYGKALYSNMQFRHICHHEWLHDLYPYNIHIKLVSISIRSIPQGMQVGQRSVTGVEVV